MKADLAQWAMAPSSWITSEASTHQHIVLSSRIRLARNLRSYAFPHKASSDAQKEILEKCFHASQASSPLSNSVAIKLQPLSKLEKQFLMERHLMSSEHAKKKGDRGLVVSPGETYSIMINEEDHLRLARFEPGLALQEAWQYLNFLDDDLNKMIPFSFHRQFGYTTTCPTNVGTGLRASCLLHLPALSLSGKIQNLITKLNQSGLTVRGFYGEGTDVVGDLFQISNTTTLGQSEENIVSGVQKTVEQIARLEIETAQTLCHGKERWVLEDRVHRAYGTLTTARLLNMNEGFHFLSLLRLGKRLNLEIPGTINGITSLFFMVQPAHIWIRGGKKNGDNQIEWRLRAEYLRNKLKKIS